jgi:Tfp pilus assembly protein PilO
MTLRSRDRVVLAIVGVVVLIGAYYMLALKPERRQVSALDAKITTQRQALATAQQSYNVGRAAQAALKSDSAEWAALALAVPEQSDIPGLLRTLEKTARAAKVSMQTISLSSSGSSTSAATTAPSSTTDGATPVPIQLTFNGGYVALNKLVRTLTALVSFAGGKVHASGPLLSINSVSLAGTGQLTGNLTATIYQLAGSAGTTTGGQG